MKNTNNPKTLAWDFLERQWNAKRQYGNSAQYATPQTIESLVRETGQNSLDAKVKDAISVTMRYTLFDLPAGCSRRKRFLEALRFKSELRPHLQGAAVDKGHGQTAVKLAAALKDLEGKKYLLRLLRVEDYGGRGLGGDEFNSPDPFCALLRDEQHSSKEDDRAGGSFGLGAKTLWSCSRVLTVLFSSIVHGEEKRGVRVIGKADLGFHSISAGADHGYVGEGFYGERKGPGHVISEWFSPTSDAKLLEDLLLTRTPPVGEARKYGTTALIVAFHDPTSDKEDSQDILKRIASSVAEYWWPAMRLGWLHAHIEHYEGDKTKPTIRREVNPKDFVPSFVDAFDRNHKNELKAKLDAPGDVISVPVQMTVPATREGMVENQHDDVTAECRLVIRMADSESADADRIGEIAHARGRAMVIRYARASGLPIGSLGFHAVLLAGELAGKDDSQTYAEVFLRYSEQPAHDKWEFWAGLRARYAYGTRQKLQNLFRDVLHALSQHVAAPPRPSDEAPEILRKHFQLPGYKPGQKSVISLKPSKSAWYGNRLSVSGSVERDKADGAKLVALKAAVQKESGTKPYELEWESFNAGGTQAPGGRFRIPNGKKSIKFDGVAYLKVPGIDLGRCAVRLTVATPARTKVDA